MKQSTLTLLESSCSVILCKSSRWVPLGTRCLSYGQIEAKPRANVEQARCNRTSSTLCRLLCLPKLTFYIAKAAVTATQCRSTLLSWKVPIAQGGTRKIWTSTGLTLHSSLPSRLPPMRPLSSFPRSSLHPPLNLPWPLPTSPSTKAALSNPSHCLHT